MSQDNDHRGGPVHVGDIPLDVPGVGSTLTAKRQARHFTQLDQVTQLVGVRDADPDLVQGNSLVGVARLGELQEKIEEGSLPLFPIDPAHMLGEATEHLARLGRLADATPADLQRARRAREQALQAVAPAAALCDLVTACRLTGEPLPVDVAKWQEIKAGLPDSKTHRAARKVLDALEPFHFPVRFPEVFLRERPGFDVIVGNPPWEKAHVEEHEFWCRHVPGFRGMSQKEREELYPELARKRPDLVDAFRNERQAADALRACLMSGMYPGMGSGHPDLYKAFCWRFWNLVCEDGGQIGVVLPRSALAAKGSTEFRKEVFAHAGDVDITMLLNNRQWFFDDVHPQYTIGLVTLEKREAERTPVALRGPYASLERYRGGVVREPAVFYGTDIESWNDTASLPLLPTDDSVDVFAQLRESPRLDLDDGSSWRGAAASG